MEEKNRNQHRTPDPEQESFEENSNPPPHEVRPKKSGQETPPDDKNQRDEGQGADGNNRQGGTHQRPPGFDEEPQENYGDPIIEDDEDETKSPLWPIDKNKAPEEWHANRQHNQQGMVEDKKDTDAVPQ